VAGDGEAKSGSVPGQPPQTLYTPPLPTEITRAFDGSGQLSVSAFIGFDEESRIETVSS